MDNIKIGLVVLIGLPAAGKTTFAKFLKMHLESPSDISGLETMPSHLVLHICYDKLLQFPVTKSEISIEWFEARKKVWSMVEKLVNDLRSRPINIGLPDKFNGNTINIRPDWLKYQRCLIIIDDNMYYKSMRYQYYQLAKSYSLSFCQVYIHCDLNEVLKRNASRSEGSFVPEEVILRMNDRLEPPNKDFNSWEKYSCIVASLKLFESDLLCDMFDVISESIAHPILPSLNNTEAVERARTACLTNVIHQADLVLRKIIGQKLSHPPLSLNKKDLAMICQMKKGAILQQLSDGTILIPEEISIQIRECNSKASLLLQEYLQDLFDKTCFN